MDWIDTTLRLGAAALIGIALGLNRYLHHKSIGVRTLGLVSVASAAIIMAVLDAATADSATRVIQGLLTGIGFIGGGLIMRNPNEQAVHGLTTAATVFVATVIGILCGLGVWPVLLPAAAIVGVLLVYGGKFEKAIARRYGAPEVDKSDHGAE